MLEGLAWTTVSEIKAGSPFFSFFLRKTLVWEQEVSSVLIHRGFG